MVFSVSITTSNGTAKADAKRTVLKVSKGLAYKFEVMFPPGCTGLQHVQIFDGSYQVYPASQQDSWHSDAETISYDDPYLKMAAPYEFVVKTWNLDDLHNHTIQVRIGLVSSEAFMSRFMPSISWEKFNKVLTQAAIDQEIQKAAAIEEFSKAFKE